MEKMIFWLNCTRAYSLPMSIMAWLIPFSYGCFHKGNILFGLLTLVGIICLHLGANLFDDIIDFKNYQKNLSKEAPINLKKGKCKLFLEEKIDIKKALGVCLVLFSIASAIGIFFIWIYKLPIIILMAITAVLCLLYPISGKVGLSEIIIGLVFSPMLFTGVYYVMTGMISKELTLLSFSFALVTVCLLYTDFFLDYNSDKIAKKKTIPVLSGSKKNAYFLYMFIIFLIYANIFVGIHSDIFPARYGLIFISVLYALKTMKKLQKYLDKEIKDEKEFISAMNTTQKFAAVFTGLCILSFYLSL